MIVNSQKQMNPIYTEPRVILNTTLNVYSFHSVTKTIYKQFLKRLYNHV